MRYNVEEYRIILVIVKIWYKKEDNSTNTSPIHYEIYNKHE